MHHARELPWKRAVIALVLFGTAFGYLEAAVVSYLRAIHEPARQRFYPGRPPGDLFPLLTLEQLRGLGSEQSHTLVIEIGREAATIVMLAAVALAVAGNAGQWAAAFVIAFGVWDATFYLFLKVLLDWPASLDTWDILFLIPVPWAGPVLAPVLISSYFMLGCCLLLARENLETKQRLSLPALALQLPGFLIWYWSFVKDSDLIQAHGYAGISYSWSLFACGLILAGLGLWLATRMGGRASLALKSGCVCA